MMKLVIPESCNQNWNEMQPASEGRFCSACAKNVIDFTGFTDAQLAAYFKTYPKNVCGKLSSGQIDRSLENSRTAKVSKSAAASKPYSIRQSPLLIGLGFSLLNITSCIPAMGKVSLGEVEITETRIADSTLSSEDFSKSEERRLNDLRLNDGKSNDGKSKEGKPEDGDVEARKELRSKPDCSKKQDNKPEDNLAFSPIIENKNLDLLQTEGSDYLTNQLSIVDTVITGTVKDTAGLPIAGVSIIIHGSPIGVTTENMLLGDVVFTGGICIRPTKWQRIKNWVTFWR